MNIILHSPHSDSNQQNIRIRSETNSNPSSSQRNSLINHRNSPTTHKIKTSSKEKSLSHILNKSPTSSHHQKKTIDAKTKLTSIKSTTSIDYEFRVQTGNESQLDGTKEPVFVELTNTKGNSFKIPLNNSINNSKPFQKGQLDIFHLNIPKNFHTVNKNNKIFKFIFSIFLDKKNQFLSSKNK
jgi:hypothetical protein